MRDGRLRLAVRLDRVVVALALAQPKARDLAIHRQEEA